MRARFGQLMGIGGARTVATTLGGVVVAVGALAAALGGKAGVAVWLRIVLGLFALMIALVIVALTLLEQTSSWRERRRRQGDSVENHFEPRGRGVARKSDRGDYFTGRACALRDLETWLSDDRGGLCVVTGDPGSGKPALGRLIAPADDGAGKRRGRAPEPDTLSSAGAIRAVWAKGRTMNDVVEEIADWIGVPANTPDALADMAVERGRSGVLVVDALDEASGEGEPGRIAQRLLKPLATTGRDTGLKVVVGTRRGRDGELLERLGPAELVVDLDTKYFQKEDVIHYVRRRLVRDGEPGKDSPYRRHPDVADQVAPAVALRAGASFLVAQLVSRSLAEADEVVDTDKGGWELRFPATVGSAMDDYLARFEQEPDRRHARELLRPLAYAEGAGLPQSLWPALASALARKTYGEDDIDWVLHTSAEDLVDHHTIDHVPTWRLFHEALSEYLRGPAELQQNRQRSLALALEATVPTRPNYRTRDWLAASPYVRAHLAAHAAAGGILDELLKDPGFLIAADPPRLLAALPAATTPDARGTRTVYRHVAHLLRDAAPGDRVAYLEMAALQVGIDSLAKRIAASHRDRRWTARWAAWHSSDHIVVEADATAVAVGEVDGRAIVVSGGADGTLRVWDLQTGTAHGDPLTGHTRGVKALAVGELDGRAIAVSGGDDWTVWVWDLHTCTGRPLTGETRAVRSLAIGELEGRAIAVSSGEDRMVRVWDLETGTARGDPLTGHTGEVSATAVGKLEGGAIAVSGGSYGELRVWDLQTGTARPLTGHTGQVRAVAVGELEGRAIAVSGSSYGELRVWDLETATGHTTRGVTAVAVGELEGRAIAVSGGDDRTVRVWDLQSGTARGDPLTGHTIGGVRALAVGELEGRAIAVSGGDDRTVRVWDLETRTARGDPLPGDTTRGVTAVAVDELEGRAIAVSGGFDGMLRVWDLETRTARGDPLLAHRSGVRALTVGKLEGHAIAVSGGAYGRLRVWDLETATLRGETESALTDAAGVRALAVGELDGRTIAVSGGDDGMLRVWDLETCTARGDPLTGHTAAVTAVALGKLEGRAIAVSGGVDRTLRIWDLAGRQSFPINVTAPVLAVGLRDEFVVIGAELGVITIDIKATNSLA